MRVEEVLGLLVRALDWSVAFIEGMGGPHPKEAEMRWEFLPGNSLLLARALAVEFIERMGGSL